MSLFNVRVTSYPPTTAALAPHHAHPFTPPSTNARSGPSWASSRASCRPACWWAPRWSSSCSRRASVSAVSECFKGGLGDACLPACPVNRLIDRSSGHHQPIPGSTTCSLADPPLVPLSFQKTTWLYGRKPSGGWSRRGSGRSWPERWRRRGSGSWGEVVGSGEVVRRLVRVHKQKEWVGVIVRPKA